MPGDRVVKVGNVSIHTGNELSYEIMNQGYKSLELTVIRNGEKVVLRDVVFGTFTESGAVFGQLDFMVYGEKFTFGSLMKHTLFNSLSTIKMVWDSLGDMLSGRYGLEAVSGPVGITNQMVETAKAGPTSFLYLVAVITMNLGVMNLLPLPALDGGRLVFVLWEMITRKKPSPKIESYIHAAGFMILMAFMVFIVFKDIIGLF
jgi:regulator of sigma E protease